ncbi:MAG: hypothetical protein ACRCVV_10335 [Shewanella sp.]
MGHGTGNDLESSDILDFSDNCENLDVLMNADEDYWVDRFNNKKPTIDYALRMAGFTPAGFDFTTGGVLKNGDRNKCVFNQADQTWYSWSGDLPYNVIAGSAPGEGWKVQTVIRRNEVLYLTDFLPKNYVISGDVDYTKYIQEGADQASKTNKSLVWPDFPLGVYPPNQIVEPECHPNVIIVKSNSKWLGTPNLKLLNTNLPGYNIILIKGEDVYLHRPKITGDFPFNTVQGEWGYGINITSKSKRVYVFEPEISNCHGDGIYIGLKWKETEPNVYPEDICIFKPRTIRCRRNGIGFTSGKNVSILYPYAEDINGTPPSAGIDIEPEAAEGYVRPVILNSRIVGGYAKNCFTGLAFNLFEHCEVDLTIEGCYDAGNSTIPYSFISSTDIEDKQKSTLFIDILKADKGLINISVQGGHKFKINKLCIREESPNFSITNQSNPLDPLVITGFEINDIVYNDNKEQQLGILTDGLQPVNKPIFMGLFRLGTLSTGLKYLYHSNPVSDFLFSEGCVFDFKSTVSGYEFFSKTVSNNIIVTGEPGYSEVSIFMDGDRRDINISASPKFSINKGLSILITSKNESNFFFEDSAGILSSQKYIRLKSHQSCKISWVPDTVKDYIVKIK